MSKKNRPIFILLGLVSVISATTSMAKVMGGGDPFGCYATRAEFNTTFCQEVHSFNIQRVNNLAVSRYMCRKNIRDWICTGEATIVIPHEGRLDK